MADLSIDGTKLCCGHCLWRIPFTDTATRRRNYLLARQHASETHSKTLPLTAKWLVDALAKHVTTTELVTFEEASATLGLSPDAIRHRAKRLGLLQHDGHGERIARANIPRLGVTPTRNLDRSEWTAVGPLSKSLGFTTSFPVMKRARKLGIAIVRFGNQSHVRTADVERLTAKPRQEKKRWTQEDAAVIRRVIAGELSVDDAAATLQRTKLSVKKLCQRLKQTAAA